MRNPRYGNRYTRRIGNRGVLRSIQVTWMGREQVFWVSYPHPKFVETWAVFAAWGACNRDEALEMFNNWRHAKAS